ncbi:MAG: ROK family protein [Haloferacaceae archaeon]
MDRSLFVGVDLGATNLRAVVGDADAELARADRRTPQGPTGDEVTEAVLDCVRRACERAGVAPAGVDAAGIASMGPLDRAAGAVVAPPNVPVDRIDLVDPLRSLLGTQRVTLRNDAVAGVVGERALGGAPPDAVYLTLSTGIGAGASVDGHVLSGHRGNAAEVGHVVVDADGRLTCGCGGPGHWEAYCSGSGIPRLAALLAEETDLSTSLPVEDGTLDAATVFARADQDPLARRTIAAVTRRNVVGLVATIHAFAPEAVRVGGAVALENAERLLPPLRERLPAHLVADVPSIELAELGADAPLLGALTCARRAVGDASTGG